MRRTHRKNNLNSMQRQILFIGILFLLCIIIGSYLNKFLYNQTDGVMGNIDNVIKFYDSDINLKSVIISNLRSDFIFLGIVCVCSLFVVTFPALIAIFTLKGLAIGYTINSCILILKYKSIKMIMLVLLKNFIIIPGAIILTIISLNYIKEVISYYKQKKRENVLFLSRRYLLNSFIIILISVGIQATFNTVSISILQFLTK